MLHEPFAAGSSVTDPFREHLQTALSSAYELERELTGGGMSRVFVAREHALGRTVVVKVLPPELAAGVNRERFRREIQLAAGLHHPHIVPVLSAGELVLQGIPASAGGELLYYTMPYIDGESLRTTLERRGKLPVREVVRILHDVVDALAYAHGRGIVHRDIKPGNILTLGSHALVTDFGVAKALSAAMPVAGVTTSGMAIGTPAYMAPEQLAGDPAADHRVDIYATGLLAYELLTGESPFTGPSPQATMAAQLTRVPEPLDRCCPDVPPALSAVIMRCLEKLPEARPQSAQALLEELEAATTSSGETASRPVAGIAAAPAPAAGAAPTGPVAPPSGRRWRAALLAIGGLAIAALATATAMRDGSRASTSDRATVSSAAPADSTLVGVAADSAPSGATAGGATVGAAAGSGSAAPGRAALTRADSLAIADAVRRQLDRQAAQGAQQRSGADAPAMPPIPVPGADAESMRVALQRVYTDSVLRSLEQMRRVRAWDPGDIDSLVEASLRHATPMVVYKRGTRRVAVAELDDATGRPELAGLGAALSRGLREAVAAEGGFDVVDDARTARAERASREPRRVGEMLRAGAVVDGIYMVRDGQLVVQLLVHDVRRGRPVRTIRSDPVPLDEPESALEPLVPRVREALDAVAWPVPSPNLVAPTPPPPPSPRRP